MAIFDKQGNALTRAYNLNEEIVTEAYDVDGNLIFNDNPIDYSNYSYTQKWPSKGIASTQGFAIYDNKVFWVSKSGDSSVPANCYVWNLADGSQALEEPYITAYTGHGNSLSFSFPLLYATTAYAGEKVYINEISNDYQTATLIKTLVLYGGLSCDACVDDLNDNILWSIHHTTSLSDRDTPWCIRKWDLSNLTDNGNGTYTPKLLKNVDIAQPANSPYFQGCAFHNNIFWYACGYSGNSVAYVFGINSNTGEYLYSINCNTTAEPEGVAWVEDESVYGGYALYVGFQGMMLRKYTFSEP